jgi:hypothetical protein
MKSRPHRFVSLSVAALTILASLAILSPPAIAQSDANAKPAFTGAVLPSTNSTSTISPQLELTYTRPSEKTKLKNYFFDGFGP